ncbi:MAG: beta-lactamase family protein [Myxococcales bacterium]|nr:beta-lactamase family protein [Myxococcales bacterium]
MRVFAGCAALSLTGCTPTLQGAIEQALSDGFEGVIHVEHRGEVLAYDAWGTAIEEGPDQPEVPHTVDTVFSVGSLTKQFTGAAILAAQDRGLLSVHDTLSDHLPQVPAARADITLHQLLTHTGGFPGGVGPDNQPIDRQAYLDLTFGGPLDVPVGAFRYSNTGYSLLAAVLETVTEQPYEQLLLDWLFLPLDMQHTGYETPDWSDSVVAHGYTDFETMGPPFTFAYDSEGPFYHLTGNGGVLSTPRDMRRWVAALADGEILSDEAREQLWAPQVGQGIPGFSYSYGWGIEEWTLMGHNIGHDGGNGFFHAFVVWWPDDELYVSVYTNHSGEFFNLLAWDLSRGVLR